MNATCLFAKAVYLSKVVSQLLRPLIGAVLRLSNNLGLPVSGPDPSTSQKKEVTPSFHDLSSVKRQESGSSERSKSAFDKEKGGG